jgi:pimeloyl-ACP methyl ester carboxylesterase
MELKRSFKGFNVLELVADEFGDPNTASRFVLFAHGGGQTRHAWQSSARLLADKGMHALSLDLRGHGESAWAADADYSMEAFAHDLIAVAAKLPKPPVLVGASLGGISGMIAAGELGKNAFEALVLVDITPKMDERGVEKIVSFMGQDLEHGFESLEAAAQSIATYLPHRKPSKNLDGLKKNLRLGEDGRYRWHWDPKFMTGTSRPSASKDPDRLSQAVQAAQIPLLLIRGKMSELVTEEAVEDFLKIVPHAKYTDVAGAGHMVAGDNNEVFTQALIEFLNET